MLLSMSDNLYTLPIVLLVPDNLFLVISQTDKKSYRRPANQHYIENHAVLKEIPLRLARRT
jgi:hypothetical protein